MLHFLSNIIRKPRHAWTCLKKDNIERFILELALTDPHFTLMLLAHQTYLKQLRRSSLAFST